MDRFNYRLLTFTCCLLLLGLRPATAANVKYIWDKTDNLRTLHQFHIVNNTAFLNEAIPAKAQLFMLANAVKSGPYEYRLRNAFIDPEGVTHARYDEYYMNLPILWADTIVHHKKSQSINGTLVTDIAKDIPSIKPVLTKERAIVIAKQDFIKNIASKNNARGKLINSRLAIYPYIQDKNGNYTAHLVYQISYYTSGLNQQLANPTYIIDANTGEVLNYFDNLKHAQVQVGTGPGGNTNPALTNGRYFYGSGGVPLLGSLFIQTDTPAGSCTWGNQGVAAVNMSNVTNNPSIFPIFENNESLYPVAIIPGCTAGSDYANLSDNGQAPVNGGISPDNDLLYFATQSYNLFVTYSNKNSKFPFGTINPAIRYYINLNSTDAFAQSAGCGDQPDACYNQQVVLGNGQTQDYPQVGYDVVGHETAHIYTDRNSRLIYANQSGGMNEAFSDITAVALGAYIGSTFPWFPPISNTPPLNNPLGISFWTQGALDSRTAPALRYLYNPPIDGSSIDNAANYSRGMDVHYSSGVYNKAFYHLSRLLGNGVLINYPAILQAYRYFVAANDMYWTANINFAQGSCGVILAAKNPVYGGSQVAFNAALKSFAAVGVRCIRGLEKITVTE